MDSNEMWMASVVGKLAGKEFDGIECRILLLSAAERWKLNIYLVAHVPLHSEAEASSRSPQPHSAAAEERFSGLSLCHEALIRFRVVGEECER
jgi:hypothetical protein